MDQLSKRKSEAIRSYAALVYASYEDTYNATSKLNEYIQAFLLNPSEHGFQACRSAWRRSRIAYGQTEAYRFYGGPIDNEEGLEAFMNAWPIDERFVDYLIDNPREYPEISKQSLEALNESISETSVFTGYHVIEFLLWGQDTDPNGPGNRPYTDYVIDAQAGSFNTERRRKYLDVVADLLLEHLARVELQWKSDGAFRTKFCDNLNSNIAIQKIFSALSSICKGEFSGERMYVAADTQDQENEQSCFSDQTLVDIKMALLGIKNVYYCKYKRLDSTTLTGTSFSEIVEIVDKSKSEKMNRAFREAEDRLEAIPDPFDQAILNHADKVMEGAKAMRQLGDALAETSRVFVIEP